MAWIPSQSVVRQTVGCFLGGSVLGEHVHSRSGLGAGALSTWGPLFCFFSAWKLLVCEFLLLFLSPGILTGARSCLQPVLSTHTAKRKAGLGVLCGFLSPAPGDSCSAASRDAQGCASTFRDCPETPGSEDPKTRGSRGPWGGRGPAWGLCPSQSLLWGGKGDWGRPGQCRLCQGWPGVSHGVAVAQPMAGRGCALQELLPTPTGALEILLLRKAMSGTVCVPLLGWSPTRQGIP